MYTSKMLLSAIGFLAFNCLALPTIAQQASDPPQRPLGTDVEFQKLAFDREKHQTDRNTEYIKAGISAGAIGVPLLVAILTIWYGILGQNKQAEQARQAREEEARYARQAREEEAQSALELKIADIAMNAPGPPEVQNRAQLLKDLFAHRLPKDFATRFDPAKYGRLTIQEGHKELMRLIAEHVEQKDEILKFWVKLWPGDTWARDILYDSYPDSPKQNMTIIWQGVDPQVLQQLNELLNQKDRELQEKIREVEEWAHRYHQLSQRLAEEGRDDVYPSNEPA